MFHEAACLVPLIDRFRQQLLTADIERESYRQKDKDTPSASPARDKAKEADVTHKRRTTLSATSESDIVLPPELAPLFVIDAAIVAAQRILSVQLDPSSFQPGGARYPPTRALLAAMRAAVPHPRAPLPRTCLRGWRRSPRRPRLQTGERQLARLTSRYRSPGARHRASAGALSFVYRRYGVRRALRLFSVRQPLLVKDRHSRFRRRQ